MFDGNLRVLLLVIQPENPLLVLQLVLVLVEGIHIARQFRLTLAEIVLIQGRGALSVVQVVVKVLLVVVQGRVTFFEQGFVRGQQKIRKTYLAVYANV